MSQRPAGGRDRIHYLERQVEEKREASRRADTLLAQLSAANAEQARTIRALEVPSYAPPEPRENHLRAPALPMREHYSGHGRLSGRHRGPAEKTLRGGGA